MMKKPPDLQSYFAMSDNWAADRTEQVLKSRRIAWIVALAAVAVALLEGLALVFLIPLEKVVPYTLLVDRHTGFVELLKPLEPASVTADAALTQSFLAQYVIAREEFDLGSIKRDYQKVALWSQGSARQAYLAAMPATNPDSPLARYPGSTIVEIRVKSVTSLDKDRAMVRFDAIRQDRGGGPGEVQPEVAVIDFGYSGNALSLEDRLINPLGFQVTRYRRSMEALPTVTAASSTADEPREILPSTPPRSAMAP